MDFNPFSMVVAIVAISVGASVANSWIRMRSLTARNSDQDQDIASLKQEVVDLRTRVVTLEKLVVDADRQLADEISKLR